MITKLGNNNYSSLLQFRSKKTTTKNDTQTKPDYHSQRTSNKIKSGVIATTAFIAGLGANQIIIPSKAEPNRMQIEYAAPSNSSSESDADAISWGEASQQNRTQQKKISDNRPASNKSRYYYEKDTVTTADGAKYIRDRKYGVKEVQSLVSETYTNLKTGKVTDTYEYNDFVMVPLHTKSTGEGGTCEEIYEGFNTKYNAPTKGTIINKFKDGSVDVYDLAYKVEIELNKDKSKPAPTKAPEQKQNEGFNELLEDGLFGF